MIINNNTNIGGIFSEGRERGDEGAAVWCGTRRDGTGWDGTKRKGTGSCVVVSNGKKRRRRCYVLTGTGRNGTEGNGMGRFGDGTLEWQRSV